MKPDRFIIENEKIIEFDYNDFNNVIRDLVHNAQREINQITLYKSKYEIYVPKLFDFNTSLLGEVQNSNIIINKFIILRDREQTKDSKEYNTMITENLLYNVMIAEIFLSSVDAKEHIEFRDLFMVDKSYCIYYLFDQSQQSIKYYLSTCKKDLEIFSDLINRIHHLNFEQNLEIRLQEPLSISANINYEIAKKYCTISYIDKNSCKWYHSAWQFLRIIDKVSSPEWHADFYLFSLSKLIMENINPKILICGTADYSLLAYVIHSCKKLGATAEIFVLDICPTPLEMCKWYADTQKVSIHILKMGVNDLNKSGDKFDIICTDAFLTRFKKKKVLEIVSIWHSILNNNGSIITTVRIKDNHEKDSILMKKRFVEECVQRFKKWDGFFNISIKEFKLLAEEYINRIVSINLGNKSNIENLFTNSGFAIEYSRKVLTKGELQETYYVNVHCRKE